MDSKRVNGLETTEFYTGKAEIYHHRASYSDECIDKLIAVAGLTTTSIVADIGAGIGNLTRQFLSKKATDVFLVEPNEDMLNRAKREISSSHVTFLNSTAESTDIPDNSVDLVIVGTAFHWFNRESFRKECLRICKENALVALLRIYMFVPDFTEKESLLEHTIKESDTDLDAFFGNKNFIKELFFHEEVFDETRFVFERLSDHNAPDPGSGDYDDFVQKSKQVFKYFGSDIINNTCITVCIYGKMS